MLISLPIGADEKAIVSWKATNRMSIEIFKACWQEVSPHLDFPGTKAGEDATCTEWEGKDKFGDVYKYEGMRNAAGLKNGIVRMVSNDGWIQEATYCEDKEHGLSFTWYGDFSSMAFTAASFDHG